MKRLIIGQINIDRCYNKFYIKKYTSLVLSSYLKKIKFRLSMFTHAHISITYIGVICENEI